MLLIKMSTPLITHIAYPLNQWDKKSIRPGPVGSVGDVLTSVRIKQSMPDMPFAYDKKHNPQNDVLRGSNVQDGQWFSFSDHGYNAQVKRRKLNKTPAMGWTKRDVTLPDRNTEPMMLDQPQQGFKSLVAETLKRQGDMFSTLPGGYAPPPNTLLRGNEFPKIQNNISQAMVMEQTPPTSNVIDQVVGTSNNSTNANANANQTGGSVVMESQPAPLNQIAKPVKNRNIYGLKIETSNLPPPMIGSSGSNASMDEKPWTESPPPMVVSPQKSIFNNFLKNIFYTAN